VLSGAVQYVLDVAAARLGEFKFVSIQHPYAVILSQGCDLESDHRLRSASKEGNLLSILFCAAYPADDYCKTIKSEVAERIVKDDHKRYLFLEACGATSDRTNEGVPELVLDFKHYFGLPTDQVYHGIESGSMARRFTLVSPYLEHLSHSFSFYFSRIGLPDRHESV
jgi:hypothetical protein